MKIILQSKRCKTLQERKLCDECGGVYDTIHRYRKSNKGEVYLCGRCIDIVWERSFGHTDAMPLRIR